MNIDRRNAAPDRGLMPWWSLRLAGPAEQMFNEQTSSDRIRQIRFWLGVSLVFYWMCLGLDAVTIPDVIWASVFVRVFVMTPLVVGSIWLLCRSRPGRGESLLIIVSPSLSMLAQLCLFAASAHDAPLLDFITLGLAVLWINVLYPMRLSETAIFSLVTMGLGDGLILWSVSRHHLVLELPPVPVAMHAIVLMSILGRIVGEQNMRRSFAKGMTLQLRVEDLSRANLKLLEMSNTDPLTGLGNRRFFDRTLDQAWRGASDDRTALSLMMIDVDYFKLFNDTAGHLEGDRCLMTIARTIEQQMRRGQDTVARFGGEEFVVLMPSTDLDLATGIAERIRAAISAQRVFHPARMAHGFVSVSIGVACLCPASGIGEPAGLMAAADKALYAAKAAGRDQVVHALA